MNKKLLNSLLDSEPTVVEDEIINEGVGKTITINADDFVMNESDGVIALAIREDNIDRLVDGGFIDISVGNTKYKNLNECLTDENKDLEILEEVYKENPLEHFNYDISKKQAQFMAGQDDVELVDGHWTYKQDGKGRVQKIEANQKFKVSKGNVKVGGNTVIINMSSGMDCTSALLGMCAVVDSCYARSGEKMRHGVLRAKRNQHTQWRAFGNKDGVGGVKLALAILTTIASMGNYTQIKFVRLNEAGDFGDLYTGQVTAKQGKELAKFRSDDVKNMEVILNTIHAIGLGGASKFEEIFNKEFNTEADFSNKVMKKLKDRSVIIAKYLGFYTYSAREDLEQGLLKLTKLKNSEGKSRFCINGSGKMLSNSFSAIEYEEFDMLFKSVTSKGKFAKTISMKDLIGSNEHLSPTMKSVITDATKTDKKTKILAPCFQDCSICDFCKIGAQYTIIIPIHGSGSSADVYGKALKKAVVEFVKGIMNDVHTEIGVPLVEAIELHYNKPAIVSKSIMKDVVKIIEKEIEDEFSKIDITVTTTKKGGKGTKDVKTTKTVNAMNDILNNLFYGKNRADFFIKTIHDSVGERALTLALFHTVETLHGLGELASSSMVMRKVDDDTLKAIAQTQAFLHPHIKTFKVLSVIKDIDNKHRKIHNLLGDVASGGQSPDKARTILNKVIKQVKELKSALSSVLSSGVSEDGQPMSHKEQDDLSKAIKGLDVTVKQANASRDAIKPSPALAKMNAEEIDEMVSKYWFELSDAVSSHNLNLHELPLIARIEELVQNTLRQENLSSKRIYASVITNLSDIALETMTKYAESRDVDVLDSEYTPNYSANTKGKAITSAIKKAPKKKAPKKVIKESLGFDLGKVETLL